MSLSARLIRVLLICAAAGAATWLYVRALLQHPNSDLYLLVAREDVALVSVACGAAVAVLGFLIALLRMQK